jgi:hypothetical protein
MKLGGGHLFLTLFNIFSIKKSLNLEKLVRVFIENDIHKYVSDLKLCKIEEGLLIF